MGLRFRKSVSFGRFFRLNFSGSGVSLGLGPRGANINVSRRGVRQTIGVPGTGLSYQTFSKWPESPPPARPSELAGVSSPAPPEHDPVATGRGQGNGALKVVMVMGVIFGLYLLFQSPSTPPAAVTQTPVILPAPRLAPAAAVAVQPAASSPEPARQPPQAPDNRPLTMDEVREAQTWLKAFALDPGPVDGLPGPLTTAAVKKYEAARQKPITGVLDQQLLDRLRKDSGGPIR